MEQNNPQQNYSPQQYYSGVIPPNKQVEQKPAFLQEGGTVDPVSGNEVPVGSMQEEVRDDIPAMLSEGEFVFPADVVRFIGLDRLMQLRQAAKEGLARMEEMGQMGNSEEATMEDDGEFESEVDDILKEVNQEYEGGESESPESKQTKAMFAEGGSVQAVQQAAEQQDLTATEDMAAPRMTASEIMRKDLEVNGLTQEEDLIMRTVTSLVRTGKSAMVQINNTVFVGTPKEEGRMKIHMFTQDPPVVLAKSIQKGIDVLKKANVNTISATTKNPRILELLESQGYEVESRQEEDTIYFKARIA